VRIIVRESVALAKKLERKKIGECGSCKKIGEKGNRRERFSEQEMRWERNHCSCERKLFLREKVVVITAVIF